MYKHKWYMSDSEPGADIELPVGKVVCVGRNYAAHAKELNNPVPKTPLLFMKPKTALASLREPITLPDGRGTCHFETEIALLVGQSLSDVSEADALEGIVGVGLALDLTLRALQTKLKDKGHPWEIAKAFDGACPISEFLPIPAGSLTPSRCRHLGLQMLLNEQEKQRGQASDMIMAIPELIAYMSRCFTLEAGDVILTGTPEGVGPLTGGQRITVSLYERGERCLSMPARVG